MAGAIGSDNENFLLTRRKEPFKFAFCFLRHCLAYLCKLVPKLFSLLHYAIGHVHVVQLRLKTMQYSRFLKFSLHILGFLKKIFRPPSVRRLNSGSYKDCVEAFVVGLVKHFQQSFVLVLLLVFQPLQCFHLLLSGLKTSTRIPQKPNPEAGAFLVQRGSSLSKIRIQSLHGHTLAPRRRVFARECQGKSETYEQFDNIAAKQLLESHSFPLDSFFKRANEFSPFFLSRLQDYNKILIRKA